MNRLSMIAALVVSALLGFLPVEGQSMDISVGEPFPDLLLPSLDGGSPMSIADFQGEKVMLHVFASW